MRLKYLWLALFSFCFEIKASGQQIFTLKGVISKNQSPVRVPQVLVIDLRSREMMISDDVGFFSIKTAIGDTLLFKKNEYTEQKIVVTSTLDIPVFMEPVIQLATVTVKGESKKQEVQDILKDYNSKGVYYNGNPPLASILMNPLNDLHLWFGKDAADLRRFKADSKEELESNEIDRRYNIGFVKKVTNAPDSVARKFMEFYRPSYEDLKGWNDYDLMKKVKSTYGYFITNRERINHQKTLFPALKKSAAPVSLYDGVIK